MNFLNFKFKSLDEINLSSEERTATGYFNHVMF